MAKKVSIATNIFLNGSVQVTSILMNIILLPYLTHIFDSQSLGINSFGQAIAGYFVLAGNLGMTVLGTRMIAETRDNQRECQNVFTQCLTYRLFFNALAMAGYCLWCYFYRQPIYYLFNILILTSITDLSWAYTGKERFDLIAIRNLIIKIVGTALIFIFVRRNDQLALFIILQQGVLFLSNIVFWTQLPKINLAPALSGLHKSLKVLFKPSIAVFIPSVFSQIYLSLDKVMLGYLSTISQVAVYDYPNKLVRIAIAFTGVIGTVLMPRFAYLNRNSMFGELRDKIRQLIQASLLCSVPLTALIILLADPLSNIFFNTTLAGADIVLKWVAPILITSSFSLYVVFVSTNRTKSLAISAAIAAGLNIIMNFLMIPAMGATGAAISTLITEMCVHVFLIICMRDLLDYKWLIKQLLLTLFIAVVCYLVADVVYPYFSNLNDILLIITLSTGYLILFYLISFAINRKEIITLIKDFRKN